MGREEHCISRCLTYRRLKLCSRKLAGHSRQQPPAQWGHRLHAAIDGYAGGIIRLIGESYGRQTVQRAWKEFNMHQTTGKPFSRYDANAELFYSWLFHKWAPAREHGHELQDQALRRIPHARLPRPPLHFAESATTDVSGKRASPPRPGFTRCLIATLDWDFAPGTCSPMHLAL